MPLLVALMAHPLPRERAGNASVRRGVVRSGREPLRRVLSPCPRARMVRSPGYRPEAPKAGCEPRAETRATDAGEKTAGSGRGVRTPPVAQSTRTKFQRAFITRRRAVAQFTRRPGSGGRAVAPVPRRRRARRRPARRAAAWPRARPHVVRRAPPRPHARVRSGSRSSAPTGSATPTRAAWPAGAPDSTSAVPLVTTML